MRAATSASIPVLPRYCLLSKRSRNVPSIIMRWRIRAIASGLFLAAALFFVSLWIRSHWTFDRVSCPLGERRTLVAISYRGSVTITLIGITIPEFWRDSGRAHPVGTRTPDMIWPRERILGFGCAYNDLMPNTPNSPSTNSPLGLTGRSWHHGGSGVMLPNWFVLTVLLCGAILPWLPPRFSLRALLAAMTLTAVLFAIFSVASRAPEVQWRNGVLVE